MIVPPYNARIFKTGNSTYWFGDGILYVVVRSGSELSMQERESQVQEFMKEMKGRTCCVIMDLTQAPVVSGDRREFNSANLPVVFKAIALICKNPLDRMIASIYLGSKSLNIPIERFSDIEKAREWISQYI
jgi:hypothetical protein